MNLQEEKLEKITTMISHYSNQKKTTTNVYIELEKKSGVFSDSVYNFLVDMLESNYAFLDGRIHELESERDDLLKEMDL